MSDSVIRDFHRLYYERGLHADYGRGLHAQTLYHGVETHQCPLDLWVFQEIVHEVRPALIIELGTYLGGTTLFLAHQLEHLGRGQVVSVDCELRESRPRHPRICYCHGNTVDDSVLGNVRQHALTSDGPVIVIHDADHRRKQVLVDLESYAPFVTLGSYMIVEDTNVNGHPVLADWGPGPWEAVEEFLGRHPEFRRDTSREKFLLTYCPGGFLRRTA
jgi:cephalosporin hydroxylase